ncbi:MAG: hypothetical protein WHX52_22080 [Anaerolineae bacterium]
MSFWKFVYRLIFTLTISACIPACVGNQHATPVTDQSKATATLIPLFPSPQYTPLPTVVEPGLASGIPCKPPCWQGVTPGDSASDVELAMQRLRASGWAYEVKGGHRGYSIYPLPTISGSIHIQMENDIATRVYGNLLFDYDVGALVELLGSEPEWVYVVNKGGRCVSCKDWPPGPYSDEIYTSPVHLLYPNQGLWFFAGTPWNGCICPEMRITSFCYYIPMSIEEALDEDRLVNLCPVSTRSLTKEDLTEWHGFGGGY